MFSVRRSKPALYGRRGGGNMILRQIKKAGYHWMDIRHIF